MKNISVFFILALLFSSCEKDDPQVLAYYDQYDSTLNFNWCNDSIACWGDSFTEGPGSWSYPSHIALDLGRSWINADYSQANYNKTVFQGGVSGQNSQNISDRFFADDYHRSWNHIIWIGRNDSWGDTAKIAARIDAMVQSIPHQRFLILGILLGDIPDEWLGTEHHAWITSFNDRMQRKYRRHFLDPKIGLQKRATRSYEDSMCLVHDISPSTLRLDFLHLSDPGYRYLAEDILKVVAPCYNPAR